MGIVLKEWIKDKVAFILLIVAIIMNSVHIVLGSALIIAIRNALDAVHDASKIRIVILIGIASLIIGPAKEFIGKYAIQHSLMKMSIRWHKKLVTSDFKMFTKYSCSKIYTVGEFLWNCANIMRDIMRLFRCAISLITALCSMYVIGGKIVIPIMIIYIAAGFVFKYLFKVYSVFDKKIHESAKARNQKLENAINGFAEIRAFGEQIEQLANMRENANEQFNLKIKRNKVSAITTMSFELVDLIGILAVLVYCIGKIGSGAITAATGMSLVMFVFNLVDPLAGILDFLDSISASTASAKDYNEIISYVNSLNYGSVDMTEFSDSIKVNDVSFAYNDSSSVLRGINLEIKKGQRIGIVGESGNGKSTLAKLLLHFYEPNDGSISIDGIDIRDITDSSFRRLVGTVQQENTIFPGSIMENVKYGSKHALENEVVDACKKAKIYDFIMSLPEKFDTEVGPRGLKLSGGQKQRIALARLFLKNPEIIILDEATSALDNGTETLIQEAIDALKGKTIITIAHRLSTIKDCDVIYVLDKNTIAESGSHAELINAGGIYASMQK